MIPNAITCGGMGAHEQWYINTKRAERIGASVRCQHCGKAMTDGNGWNAWYSAGGDVILPLDAADLHDAEWITLGNECVKVFAAGTDRPRYFRKAAETVTNL